MDNAYAYEYKPIAEDEIRLLHITADDELRVTYSLTAFQDDSIPPYIALSYVWGSGTATFDLPIDPDGQILRIGSNLWDALSNLSLTLVELVKEEGNPLFIWIDAICIEQTNLAEKSSQVRKMRQIFERANSVFVWFGLDELGMDNTFKPGVLENFEQQLSNLVEQDRGTIPTDELQKFGLPAYDEKIWGHLGWLFSTKWGQRGWVVQEAVLAAAITVSCGPWITPWTLLYSIATKLLLLGLGTHLRDGDKGNTTTVSHFHSIANAREYYSDGELDLFRLLSLISVKNLTKSIDRVYCLYGLFDDELKTRIKIDYGRESRYWEPIIDVMSYATEHNFDFRLLPSRKTHPDDRIPSWCPILYGDLIPMRGILYYQAGYTSHEAKNQNSLVQVDPTKTLMTIRGFTIDVVRDIASARFPSDASEWDAEPASPSEVSKYLQCNKEFWELAMGAMKGTQEQKREQYARCLAQDILVPPPAEQPSGMDYIRTCDALIKEAAEALAATEDDKLTDGVWIAKTSFTRRFIGMTPPSERPFFTTKNGFIGFGHWQMRPGDTVCTFYGASSPFILRCKSDNTYTIVGTTYLQGFMYLRDTPTDFQGKEQMFAIR